MKIQYSNFNNLDNEIHLFESSSSTYWLEKRYLIMNENTENKMITNTNLDNIKYGLPIIYKKGVGDLGKIATYKGTVILIDNSLEDNIIDIR